MTLAQDLRFAVRLLWRDRWFAVAAIVALSLGIGVNTTVFTFVNAVLLRDLPFPDAHQIMYVGTRVPPRWNVGTVSYPDYADWKAQTTTFADLGAYTQGTMNVSEAGKLPERYAGAWVTANTFRILRQSLLLGRDFRADDDRAGAEPVVILGYGMWQARYGGDRSVLGRVIRINEVPAIIIGVMPEGMKFPVSAELWQPLVRTAEREPRRARIINVFGRLRDGVGRDEAQADLSAIALRLAEQYPDTNKDPETKRPLDAALMTFNERYNGAEIRLVFLALMGAVTFVLLIACANVANLLLARSVHRAREIAVRVSLGASRWRIVRQLLVESVLLGVLSGAVGLLLSLVGVRLFDQAVADFGKPYWIRFTMDLRVYGFLAAVCVATGIIFGLAPALHVSKTNVTEVLKEGGGRGGGGGARARRLTGALVIAEIVFTLVLLTGAGLMIRSFLKLYRLDLGVETERVLTMRLLLPEAKYPTPAHRVAFEERLAERMSGAPDVMAMSVASTLPTAGAMLRPIEIDTHPLSPGERPAEVSVLSVGDRYFEALDVRPLGGRTFLASDGRPGAEAVVVNGRFASQWFGATNPVGHRVRFLEGAEPNRTPGPSMTIVGVTPAIRQRAFFEPDPDAVVYVPYRQAAERGMSIVVRSRGEPGPLAARVRETLQTIDPDLPVFGVMTLEAFLAQQRWPFRIFGSLFAIFALIALALAAVGIYAVTAYSVVQRTQEIGVRMALGAPAAHVSWTILRQGVLRLAVGIVIGLGGAYLVGSALDGTFSGGDRLLAQTSGTDPLTWGAVLVVLAGVTIAACLIPARRASRLDPVAALRME